MADRKWPSLSDSEAQMVRETSFPAFQIGVGKSVQKKKWKEIADPQEYNFYEDFGDLRITLQSGKQEATMSIIVPQGRYLYQRSCIDRLIQ
jgi:hypothetical protein